MTNRYSEIDQHDALYASAMAYPGSIPALAHRLSTADKTMSPNVLRNKLSPGISTHATSFEEVSRTIELCVQAGVKSAFDALHAFCWRHNHVAVQLPTVVATPGDLLKKVVEIIGDEGRLASDINEALAGDGKINDREEQTIEKDLQECIEALVQLHYMVVRKHEADCHKS